jgi:hypothetical protein
LFEKKYFSVFIVALIVPCGGGALCRKVPFAELVPIALKVLTGQTSKTAKVCLQGKINQFTFTV